MPIEILRVLDSLVEEDFVEMNVTICDREVTSGILTGSGHDVFVCNLNGMLLNCSK